MPPPLTGGSNNQRSYSGPTTGSAFDSRTIPDSQGGGNLGVMSFQSMQDQQQAGFAEQNSQPGWVVVQVETDGPFAGAGVGVYFGLIPNPDYTLGPLTTNEDGLPDSSLTVQTQPMLGTYFYSMSPDGSQMFGWTEMFGPVYGDQLYTASQTMTVGTVNGWEGAEVSLFQWSTGQPGAGITIDYLQNEDAWVIQSTWTEGSSSFQGPIVTNNTYIGSAWTHGIGGRF